MTTDTRHRDDSGHPRPDTPAAGNDLNPALERLTDLERRSLLAEQARQQAHRLRTPLSVIELIAETLQLEGPDGTERAARLARIQQAAGTLAGELTDAVRSTRFGDGPRQRLDPAALAVDVVLAFGGEVAAAHAPAATALVEPASLAAALVHAMRLVGVGTDCNGVCTQRPCLRTAHDDGQLLLAITARGAEPSDTPRERADLALMARAAARVAQDHGGSLTLGPDSAVFRLPLEAAG
jgi:signal transduction histidine kinase